MMRRSLLFAACLVALLCAAVAGQQAPEEALPDNLLRNSSFAEDAYWILKGDSTFFAAGGGRMNDGAVAMSPREPYQEEVVQTIGPGLVPGRRYAVTAWVRAKSEGAIAVLGVRWEGGHPRVFRGLDPESGWSRIEFRFTAPEEDGWRQVVLSGSGELIWDDVELYEADTLEARLAKTWEERLASGEPIYTGLVVNARGTSLQRGMSPKIFDENGRLVFAGIGAGESQLIQEGIVAYSTSLAAAISHERLKVSEVYPIRLPLVIDVQSVRGMPETDVVIGEADADMIARAVERYDFLGRFAVVIVHEPFAGLSTWR